MGNGKLGLGEEEKKEEKKRWWQKVAVEPVLFLYMMAFMVTSVAEEAFFLDKACRVNLGFPDAVCDNISSHDYANYKKLVQVEVSTFHQYENIASHGVPVVLAFFLGAWSDRIGRKIPLLLGLLGSLVYSLMIVVNALQENWPLEMVIFSASLPCALTGGSLSVFMASFSYLADTTSQKARTLRTTFLEAAYLLPMPIGVALGSYLFKVVDGSYAAMFCINSGLLLASITWGLVVLERKTTPPRLVTPSSIEEDTSVCSSALCFSSAVESIRSLFKKRPDSRRTILLLVLLGMALYTFQRDEKHMIYLYSQLEFQWGVTEFSQFRTFQSALFVAGLLVGVPIMLKKFKVRDNLTVVIGACSHILARIVFILAKTPWLLYLGAGLGWLGPIVAPVFRSVISKLVPSSERGKVFAMFTVADTTVPLLSGVAYTQVYNHTIASFPQAIFLVTIASQLLVLVIALGIHFGISSQNITQAESRSRQSSC